MCRVVPWELTLSDTTSISGASEQHFSATQNETITRQLDEGVHEIDLQGGYNSGGTRSPAGRVVQSLYSN